MEVNKYSSAGLLTLAQQQTYSRNAVAYISLMDLSYTEKQFPYEHLSTLEHHQLFEEIPIAKL